MAIRDGLLTLKDYLDQEEYNHSHVMVSEGKNYPHEAYHPIADAYLAILKQVWTLGYYTWMQNRAWRNKGERYLKKSKAMQKHIA